MAQVILQRPQRTPGSYMTSEQRLGQFLSASAENDMSSTTPNQAFSAVIFPCKKVPGAEVRIIQALRESRETAREGKFRLDSLCPTSAV